MNSRLTRISVRQNWFPLAVAVIATVSLYDTFLIVYFQSVINSTEQNPIGLWLLKLGDGNIGIFVRMKLAGTVIVLSTLYGMWTFRSPLAFPVTTSIASYQAGLFVYLTIV